MADRSGTTPDSDGMRQFTVNQIARLAALWKTFEESGGVSAYIAYRRQLTQLVRQETPTYGTSS